MSRGHFGVKRYEQLTHKHTHQNNMCGANGALHDIDEIVVYSRHSVDCIMY